MRARPDLARLYREDGQRRWERLQSEMVASGEVTPEQLDLTPESLRVVWGWVLPRLRKRPPGEPVDRERQPPWWDGPMWESDASWDDATHDLVGAVAYYFGEVRVRSPGAAWAAGLAGTSDEGEPVIEDEQAHINPLGQVMIALVDVWNGRQDPDALVRLALHRSEPQSLDFLYDTRLVLRLRGRPAGMLRRRGDLDRLRVAHGVGRMLELAPVELAPGGQTFFEHIGSGDWRARVEVDAAAGVVHEVRVVIGAPWDERPGPGRAEQVRSLVDDLLLLSAEVGGEVDIVQGQPGQLDAPHPKGLLTADRVAEVLEAVELGPSRRRPR